MRKRGGLKRAIGTRAPMLIPMAANDRWSLDFVSDQLIDGRRFRILTVVDDCTRECLALVADTSLSGLRVARELDRIIEERGKPRMIVSDNGSEFTSNAILQWTDRSKVDWHYIAPGASFARSSMKWLRISMMEPRRSSSSFIGLVASIPSCACRSGAAGKETRRCEGFPQVRLPVMRTWATAAA